MVNMSPEFWLKEQFQNRDWFHSVGQDQYGRYVVYVHYMNTETLRDIPDSLGGKQVLCHFAASFLATSGQFITGRFVTTQTNNEPFNFISDVTDDAELVDDEPLDEKLLIKDLIRLERICGSNIMQDIFYEVHDKHNAVTNLSVKFPDVRASMETLYQKYGFDLIYENMDG